MRPGAGIDLRDITDLDGCQAVVDVQHDVWGEVFDIVPASLLFVSVKRGGVLVGAFAGDTLVGFVWSMPGWHRGQPTHWSHMLGVLEPARGRGIGMALKRAQRDRVLAGGISVIEWTFDPLQARNAHLNMSRLGCVASIYLENAYGELDGPLHRGTPTDRLVAEWRLDEPGMSVRLESGLGLGSRTSVAGPAIITTRPAGLWTEPVEVSPKLPASPVTIPVPASFGAMQLESTALARNWRLATREAFDLCFAAGYQVVGFDFDRELGCGRYALINPAAS